MLLARGQKRRFSELRNGARRARKFCDYMIYFGIKVMLSCEKARKQSRVVCNDAENAY